jgi:hypothetical protein
MSHNTPAPNPRDWGVSWLRTVVPTAWGALITFLLSRFPDVHEALSGPGVTMAVTAVAVALWYSLWRWLEPRLPAFLTALLLGSNARPTYPATVAGEVLSTSDFPYTGPGR